MTESPDHLKEETLLSLAEGERPGAQARVHLDRCRPCSQQLEEMERLVEQMRADRTPEPAPALLSRAIGLFPARPSRARQMVEALARLVRGEAEWSLAAAAVGVRGGSHDPARLLFAGDDVYVDLELVPVEAGTRVTGQVFGRPSDQLPTLVYAERTSQAVAAAAVGDHGLFVFDCMPAGDFDLILDLGQRRLRLPVRPGSA